ncbi:MAG TPA: NADH-quinone oxidoreductase subunit J, partial [Telluria sp.]|nr:NADH-quinone oxidoreductase subunit J [Telluria sp.]
VVLLVAIIAAVALTLRKRKDTKHFDAGDAVRVKRNDRLRIVKMATVDQPAIDAASKAAALAAAAAQEAKAKEPT